MTQETQHLIIHYQHDYQIQNDGVKQRSQNLNFSKNQESEDDNSLSNA
ncbi:hypothetical protein H6F96_22010 [Microcoleus sp. FACHB-53]|nr:hypothetical protein [Microcoleus sp. FACHB-53]